MNSKPKLLVVDDEEINRSYLESFLGHGYDVYTCGNVNNFYRLVSILNFDVVIMDVWLRDSKDGIQLTRELKKNNRYRNIPVLILTANNDKKTLNDAIDAGAAGILEKTVNRNTLIDELKNMCMNNKELCKKI